jgi:hypothetical protein
MRSDREMVDQAIVNLELVKKKLIISQTYDMYTCRKSVLYLCEEARAQTTPECVLR